MSSNIDRRTVLRAALGAALAVPATRLLAALPAHADQVWVAPGYTSDLVVRWGDAMFQDTPSLDARIGRRGVLDLPPAQAARQFGYNCDGLQFYGQGRHGRRGLLAVNHEYPSPELYLPDLAQPLASLPADERRRYVQRHPEIVPLMQAMNGISVLQLERDRQRGWHHRAGSRYARRITTHTPFEVLGPARGHPLLQTHADPSGTRVLGTLGNCAGGRTPWGSYLSAEENVDEYFGNGAAMASAPRRLRDANRRIIPRASGLYGWEHVDPRFDLAEEPAELLRFGWVVEVNPRDAGSTPRKRTALGRFKHECATCASSRDGRLAVYMGDDQAFEYIYKYVSRQSLRRGGASANDRLLDEGVLYVARFDEDGSGQWLPLLHGHGPLSKRNGFADQGEVLINARAAADLLGATTMDRPEDIAVDESRGRVYVALTKNPRREPGSSRRVVSGREIDVGVNAANPRGPNPYGHVMEITEDGADCGALRFRWQILLKGGAEAAGDPIGAPDNMTLDSEGRLWVVTDGDQPEGEADGCFMVVRDGPQRGEARRVMTAPIGAEVCGCKFSADGSSLFLSIQHPGEGGTLHAPLSAWPDGRGHMARPSVIALRRADGGKL